MYSVDLNFWSFVLCMGLFFTSIRSIEDAYFEMQVAVDGDCSEKALNSATTVIGFFINKTDSEIWRCSNTCSQISQITNCKSTVTKAACLFTVADAKTIANRDEITHILAEIYANAAVNTKFHFNSTYAICSTFEYINRTTNLTVYQRLKHMKDNNRSSHGTTNPIGLTSPPTIWGGGSHSTTNPIGLTSPPTIWGGGSHGTVNPIGLTSPPTIWGGGSHGTTNPIALTSPPTILGGDSHGTTNPIGLTSPPTIWGGGSHGTTNPIALTSPPTILGGGSHITTNPIGLTSPPTIWRGGSHGTTNPIGLTSPPTILGGGSHGTTNPIGLTSPPTIWGSHGTTNPIGLTSPPTIWGSHDTTNPIGLTSPPTIWGAYFEVHLSIDNPCDEDAILKATNILRSVLHLKDKKIWRCQDNCTLDTNCSDGHLTFCLFFEADEYTRTNSAELNSSLSKDVTCGNGTLVLEPSPEFERLHQISTSGTGSNEPQTGEGPGTGAIVGGTVGGLAGLAGAVMAGWRIIRKLKKNQVSDTASTGDTTPISPGGIDFEEAPNSVPPAGV
ncbi:uncharacterized protein LOC127853299 [Dreissena polymorpha]|uniref:uncharacterized protein LOC127853299 n=1 Tax=Dreissena polymorpha TaxID=45954 RepID=UPI002263E61C|nr:uncharacterized protein LOC127853299 [Dreissena polymorpha]